MSRRPAAPGKAQASLVKDQVADQALVIRARKVKARGRGLGPGRGALLRSAVDRASMVRCAGA
jgi:hypothetical protein